MIVYESSSHVKYALHFIYDSQERVIEEQKFLRDSLIEHYTYEYTGNNILPFKRNYFANSNYINVLSYNSNGQKIYDSSYSIGFPMYIVARIDYYASNRISVIQTSNYLQNIAIDTIFLNSEGNIDSIRDYSKDISTAVTQHMATQTYSHYLTQPNYFKSLSTFSSDFYSLNGTFGGFQAQYRPVIDYFNGNNFTIYSLYYATNPSNIVYYDQHEYQFNSNQLPISDKVITRQFNNIDTLNCTFVYQ